VSIYDIFSLFRLTLGGTGLDQQDVSVLYDVLLALRHDLTLGLDLGLVTQLLEHVKVVHNSLDESLLEVRVDNTSGLGGLDTKADGPLADLIGTGGEETAKTQGLAHLEDDLGQSRVGTNVLALLEGSSLRLELGQTLLERDGERDNGVASGVLLDPLGNLGKVLVLLANVVPLRQVDEVDDGLRRQEEKRVDDLDLWLDSVSACLKLAFPEFIKVKERVCYVRVGVFSQDVLCVV
jgi:hypothetical protein